MSAAARVRALIREDKLQKAWFAVNHAMNEDPDNPELLYMAGTIMRGQGHIGLSYALFAKALAKDQRQPNLWMHYAASLHDLNQWDDAITAFKTVHAMIPKDPMPPANISASYSQKGKWRETLEWADKSLKLDKDNYIAHIAAGVASLALGRWEDGWKHNDYLYGNHLVERIYNSPDKEEPRWDGSPGKTVVVQCDQGVGDILMYSQCLPQMIAECKEVIIECAERMVPLMRRNFPQTKVYGTLKKQEQDWSLNHDIDAHIHISSIPKFYLKRDTDFKRVPYITPDPVKVENWKLWLSTLPKPWIGLAWQGGIQRTHKHLRSLDLEQLEPVLSCRGSFIDLTYKDNSAEIREWNSRGAQVIKPPLDETDYDDTVALVSCLDEVVTVTTAIVHACGALGRSAKVLVPEVPTWRYAYRGMLWYTEAVKMYRQVPGEQWASVIKRLANDVQPKILLAA